MTTSEGRSRPTDERDPTSAEIDRDIQRLRAQLQGVAVTLQAMLATDRRFTGYRVTVEAEPPPPDRQEPP